MDTSACEALYQDTTSQNQTFVSTNDDSSSGLNSSSNSTLAIGSFYRFLFSPTLDSVFQKSLSMGKNIQFLKRAIVINI